MSLSFARCRAPGTAWPVSLGTSSNKAERPRKEGVLEIRLWTIEKPSLVEDLSGVALGEAWGLANKIFGDLVPGEGSGESEGNDSSVFAEVGVTSECFRDAALAVPGFRAVADA